MWKPRLASFALCVFSLPIFWSLPPTESTYAHFAPLVVTFAAIGIFCGCSGIVASFLATPSGDTYFVPADNALIRFLVKRKIIDLSRNMGFCEYSICVGGSTVLGVLLLLLMGLIGYALFVMPMKVIPEAFMLIGLVACIFVLAIKFPKILLALATPLALFVCFQTFTSSRSVDVTHALIIVALVIGIIGTLFYVRHLLSKTRIYARFCPQYAKTESTS